MIIKKLIRAMIFIFAAMTLGVNSVGGPWWVFAAYCFGLSVFLAGWISDD